MLSSNQRNEGFENKKVQLQLRVGLGMPLILFYFVLLLQRWRPHK